MSITNLAKFYQISPVFPIEIAICLRRIYHPESKFAARTSLAVSSIEYCDCLFDERDLRERLGGGCGHKFSLPLEHQRLLQLAKEQHILDVVPLQELKAGQTGAFLYLASVSLGDTRRVQHFVVKFDRVNERAKSSETERHRLAHSEAMGKGTIPVFN